jgi:hypothetical protein
MFHHEEARPRNPKGFLTKLYPARPAPVQTKALHWLFFFCTGYRHRPQTAKFVPRQILTNLLLLLYETMVIDVIF